MVAGGAVEEGAVDKRLPIRNAETAQYGRRIASPRNSGHCQWK